MRDHMKLWEEQGHKMTPPFAMNGSSEYYGASESKRNREMWENLT